MRTINNDEFLKEVAKKVNEVRIKFNELKYNERNSKKLLELCKEANLPYYVKMTMWFKDHGHIIKSKKIGNSYSIEFNSTPIYYNEIGVFLKGLNTKRTNQSPKLIIENIDYLIDIKELILKGVSDDVIRKFFKIEKI